MKPTQVIALLPGFSKPDLAAIRAAADSLLGSQVSANEGAGTPLFDALCRALGLRLAFGPFMATATYKAYRRGEQAIEDFLNVLHWPRDRVMYNSILSFMLECLMDDLKERKVPISLGSVCSNLERCPEVFKAAFPGYIEGGASHLILNRMTKGR